MDASYNRPHNPIKAVDQADITTLFTIVQDGINYNALKLFISERNNTYKLSNEYGETVIHMILQNDSSSISEEQQLNLIEFFVNHGVSASSFNKNNETPLYLAAKYQKPKIVKYLIDIGVSTNVETNQGMNPVHAAVQGMVEKCKPVRKVKKIIPKPKVPMKSIKFSKLSVSILDLLSRKPFSSYSNNVRDILSHMDDIYSEDMEELKKEFKKDLDSSLSDIGDVGDKRQKVQQIISSFIDQSYDIVKQKLGSAIEPVKLAESNDDGWGPTGTSTAILKRDYTSDAIRTFRDGNDLKSLDVFNSDQLNNQFSELELCKDRFYGGLAKIIRMSNFIQTNTTPMIIGATGVGKKISLKFTQNQVAASHFALIEYEDAHFLNLKPTAINNYRGLVEIVDLVNQTKNIALFNDTGSFLIGGISRNYIQVESNSQININPDTIYQIKFINEPVKVLGYDVRLVSEQNDESFSYRPVIEVGKHTAQGPTNVEYYLDPINPAILGRLEYQNLENINYMKKFVGNKMVFFELVDKNGVIDDVQNDKMPSVINLGNLVSVNNQNQNTGHFTFTEQFDQNVIGKLGKNHYIRMNCYPEIADISMKNTKDTFDKLFDLVNDAIYSHGKIQDAMPRSYMVDSKTADRMKRNVEEIRLFDFSFIISMLAGNGINTVTIEEFKGQTENEIKKNIINKVPRNPKDKYDYIRNNLNRLWDEAVINNLDNKKTLDQQRHNPNMYLEYKQMTFASKLLFYVQQILNHKKVINYYVNMIKGQQYRKNIYKHVSMIMLNMLNIINNIHFAMKELDFCITKMRQIKTMVGRKPENIGSMMFALTNMRVDVDELTKVFTDLKDTFKKLYQSIRSFHGKDMSLLVNKLNADNSYGVAKLYLNRDFTSNDDVVFDKIFEKQIKIPTKQLPMLLEKYSDKYGSIANRNMLRQQLFRDFIPQISKKNMNKYYGASQQSQQSAKCGFDVSLYYPMKMKRKINNVMDGTELTNCGNLEVGKNKIGRIEHGPRGPNKNGVPSSIGPILPQFINAIKYLMIQNVLIAFNDSKLDPDKNSINFPSLDGILQGTNKLQITGKLDEVRNDIKQEIMEKTGITKEGEYDINSMILTVIAKLADELITIHFKRLAFKSAKNYITSIIRPLTDPALIKPYENLKNAKNAIPLPDNIVETPMHKIDRGFSLNLRDLFDSIVQDFTRVVEGETSKIFTNLSYTNRLVVKHDLPEQFQLTNPDYHQKNIELERECYKIDKNVLLNLLDPSKAKVNVNHKDFVKSTPIFYSIDNLNYEITELLIDKGALVDTIKVRNLGGFTPYEYAINNMKVHSSLIMENKLYKPFYKSIEKTILDNPTSGNNIITFMEDILPQTLMMYDHFLSNKITSYSSNWTYENLKELSKLLSDSDDDQLLFKRYQPLVALIEKSVIDTALKSEMNVSVLRDKKSDIEEEKKKLATNLRDLTQRNESYKNEIVMMKEDSSNNDIAIKALTDKQKEVEHDITINENKQKELEEDVKKLESNVVARSTDLKTDIKKIDDNKKSKLMKYVDGSNVTKYYNNVFDIICNNDSMLYNKIYNIYINNSDEDDYRTNIYRMVVRKINQLAKEKSLTNGQIELLTKLHTDVITRVARDYEDLPFEYGVKNNYVLTEVVDIISNVAGRVICGNMYLAIIKTITKFVIETNPNNANDDEDETFKYNNKIRKIVEGLLNFTNTMETTVQKPIPKNATMQNYIIKKMPIIFAKFTLKVFDGDELEDPHAQIVTVDRLFEPITDVIMASNMLDIDETSSLIQNLREYIFPYYKNLLEEFIPVMKVMIDNYNRYLINQEKHLLITKLLAESKDKWMNK
jgi:ankyrin repeat protein